MVGHWCGLVRLGMVTKVCERKACGKVYTPHPRNVERQRFCSRACSAANRSRLSRVEAGRKGGSRRGEKYRIRISNIRQASYRRGFSDGYEQALKDTEAVVKLERRR